MKVLIACEESQEVCKAFRRRGHEAYAYESKHAYGFYAVRQELESLIELVSEILKEQKQIWRNK